MGIRQEIKIWPYYLMVHAQTRIRHEEWDKQIKTDNLIPARKPDLELSSKKKRTCHLVDFAVSADHTERIKEREKIDKYLDQTKELKNTMEHNGDDDTNCNLYSWNRPQSLAVNQELEIWGRIETIQTTALLRSARIFRRVLKTCGDLQSCKFQIGRNLLRLQKSKIVNTIQLGNGC